MHYESMSNASEKDWGDRIQSCIQDYYSLTKDWCSYVTDASEEHQNKRADQAQKRHSNLYTVLTEWSML